MSLHNRRKVSYHLLIVLALIVGVFGIISQFLPGWELLSFMLSVAVLGGLIGGSNSYAEQDRQQLKQSYKTAYEWLLLIMMAAYFFNELSKWLHIEEVVVFLSGHWPGLILAMMCGLMGLAGFQKSGRTGMTT